jgi:hypothetical protein
MIRQTVPIRLAAQQAHACLPLCSVEHILVNKHHSSNVLDIRDVFQKLFKFLAKFEITDQPV